MGCGRVPREGHGGREVCCAIARIGRRRLCQRFDSSSNVLVKDGHCGSSLVLAGVFESSYDRVQLGRVLGICPTTEQQRQPPLGRPVVRIYGLWCLRSQEVSTAVYPAGKRARQQAVMNSASHEAGVDIAGRSEYTIAICEVGWYCENDDAPDDSR